MKLYVYKVRMEKNLSIRQLSRMSGVSKSYIERLERSESNVNPPVKVMCRLAKALQVDVMDLFSCD